MNLAKEMKKKRDAEKRLEQNSPTTIFVEGGDGEKSYNDYSNFATKKQLNDGLEEKAEIDHTHKFTDLIDTPIDYIGQAGKVAKVNATEDGLEFGEGGSGGELVQATETELGGIKAKPRTTEMNEVTIDEVTGKLYALSPDEAANGLPAGGTAGQMLSKIDGTDYNAEWIDATSGGGIVEIPQATETELGGIKAKPRTTEMNEVTIDTSTGKLYTPTIGIGGTDAESILSKPIVIPSFEGKDGYILAYDEIIGEFNLKKAEQGGGPDPGIISGVLLKAEDLIEILVGTGIKTMEEAFISPYMDYALLYKGSADTTRLDTFDFTSGDGVMKIYYEYHTENISYDWGVFYLDNIQIAKFGGARDVRYLEVPISSGIHGFKIEYRKDGSGDGGYDGIKIYAINYPTAE